MEEHSARVTRNDDSNCIWAILSKVSGIVGIGRRPLGGLVAIFIAIALSMLGY